MCLFVRSKGGNYIGQTVQVVNMNNQSLEHFISRLSKYPQFQITEISSEQDSQIIAACKETGADILLIDISSEEGSADSRMKLINHMRDSIPDCKIVVYADTAMSANNTDAVKHLYGYRYIDEFFFPSCSFEYMVLKLETLWSYKELRDRQEHKN